jgi:hypothetical protein
MSAEERKLKSIHALCSVADQNKASAHERMANNSKVNADSIRTRTLLSNVDRFQCRQFEGKDADDQPTFEYGLFRWVNGIAGDVDVKEEAL